MRTGRRLCSRPIAVGCHSWQAPGGSSQSLRGSSPSCRRTGACACRTSDRTGHGTWQLQARCKKCRVLGNQSPPPGETADDAQPIWTGSEGPRAVAPIGRRQAAPAGPLQERKWPIGLRSDRVALESRMSAVTWGLWQTLRFRSPLILLRTTYGAVSTTDHPARTEPAQSARFHSRVTIRNRCQAR